MNGSASLAGLVGHRWRCASRLQSVLTLMTICASGLWFHPVLAEVSNGQGASLSTFQRELSKDQMSVRELMRLDADLALRRMQKGLSNRSFDASVVSEGEQAGTASRSTPRLIAIYGVGKRLLAEVVWQGQSYVYMKGQASPVGRNGAASLRLKSMGPRCVTLQDQGQQFELCLGTITPGG